MLSYLYKASNEAFMAVMTHAELIIHTDPMKTQIKSAYKERRSFDEVFNTAIKDDLESFVFISDVTIW